MSIDMACELCGALGLFGMFVLPGMKDSDITLTRSDEKIVCRDEDACFKRRQTA